MARVAQVANAVWPASGGVRVTVHALGDEEIRCGGERLLLRPGPGRVLPGASADRERVIVGARLPGSGAYRLLVRRAEVRRALQEFAPDILQVHDQTTLTWLGRWARSARVPSILFAHDHTGHLMADLGRIPQNMAQAAGRSWSRRISDQFDAVICSSQFSAAPFLALDAPNVHVVPLGVDLVQFAPRRGGAEQQLWGPGALRLVFSGRFWPEKAPMIALDTLAELRAEGLPAELVLIGDGPLAPALRRRAQADRLPVRMLGHVADRYRIAHVLAAADVCISPGARETFGLGILESMAAGTPVVVRNTGAAPELICPGAGLTATTPAEFAAAARRLVTDPGARAAARRRAEGYSWNRTFAAVRALQDDLRLRCSEQAGAGRWPMLSAGSGRAVRRVRSGSDAST